MKISLTLGLFVVAADFITGGAAQCSLKNNGVLGDFTCWPACGTGTQCCAGQCIAVPSGGVGLGAEENGWLRDSSLTNEDAGLTATEIPGVKPSDGKLSDRGTMSCPMLPKGTPYAELGDFTCWPRCEEGTQCCKRQCVRVASDEDDAPPTPPTLTDEQQATMDAIFLMPSDASVDAQQAVIAFGLTPDIVRSMSDENLIDVNFSLSDIFLVRGAGNFFDPSLQPDGVDKEWEPHPRCAGDRTACWCALQTLGGGETTATSGGFCAASVDACTAAAGRWGARCAHGDNAPLKLATQGTARDYERPTGDNGGGDGGLFARGDNDPTTLPHEEGGRDIRRPPSTSSGSSSSSSSSSSMSTSPEVTGCSSQQKQDIEDALEWISDNMNSISNKMGQNDLLEWPNANSKQNLLDKVRSDKLKIKCVDEKSRCDVDYDDDGNVVGWLNGKVYPVVADNTVTLCADNIDNFGDSSGYGSYAKTIAHEISHLVRWNMHRTQCSKKWCTKPRYSRSVGLATYWAFHGASAAYSSSQCKSDCGI